MNNKKFDERQLWIRGNIFQHMLVIIATLVITNALLIKCDIIWADGFYSNLIIFFVAIAAGSIEMIFREVYFQSRKQQWLIVLFGLCGLMLVILNIIHLIRGDGFILDGSLTETGGSFIYGILILSMGISGAIKLLSDKIKKHV